MCKEETKYLVWPCGTELECKDEKGNVETGHETPVRWTVKKVGKWLDNGEWDGDVMTLTRTGWEGSLNQAWNGGGTYWRYTRTVKVTATGSEDVEPEKVELA